MVSANVEGIVNYELGTYPQEVPAVNGISNYTLGTYPTEAPDITGSASYTGSFPTSAPTLYGTVVYTASFGHFAHGTRNAPEGLAYLNDDGSADPRELVEHNGQFLMYEGRNVLLRCQREIEYLHHQKQRNFIRTWHSSLCDRT